MSTGMKLLGWVVIMLSFTCGAFAQSTMNKKLKPIPYDYNQSPTGEITNDERFSALNAGNLWVVYSESDHNVTYTAPPSGKGAAEGTQAKEMSYMDAFYVIDQKGEWLHIVKWEQLDLHSFDYKTFVLKKDLGDWGWVKQDKMLLWGKSIIDKDTHFTIKALTVNNSACIKNPENCIKGREGKVMQLFSNPELTVPNKNDVRLFEFLYVFKRVGHSILVSRQDELLKSECKFAPRKMLGWISDETIKEWKQRLVLEPNWDDDAVKERTRRNIKPLIFPNESYTKKFMDNPVSTEGFMIDKDPGAVRSAPEVKRLPLLDTKFANIESQVIRTGAVSSIYNTDGKVAIQSDQEIMLRKAGSEQRENFRKVNIVFVIDGSRYMKQFQPNILESISDFINDIHATNSTDEGEEGADPNKYKIGAVIYRGTQDKNCQDGELDVQSQDLTVNYPDVFEFVKKKFEKTGCSDKENTKAYYKGLSQALRLFGDCKKQSNIVVVIGSAGNSNGPEFDAIKKSVKNGLINYQVGILAFQVQSGADKYFTDFLTQTKKFIRSTADAWQDSIATLTAKTLPKVSSIDGLQSYKIKCPEESTIPGQIMFTASNEPMNADTLKQGILNLIKETTDAKGEILEGIDSRLNGLGTKMPVNPGMLLFLKNMNVDEKLLKQTSYDNVQLYVDGWTAYKPQGLTNPLYKICVFISEPELNGLIENLRKIESNNLGSEDQRKKMQQGFLNIISAYFGPKEAKKKIVNMTGDDLMQLMGGLPANDPVLKSFKLDDIVNKKKVTESALANLTFTIGEKLTKLESYSQEAGHYFKSGDKNYFWVPQDYFP